EITRFELTIGDTGKNFDGAFGNLIPPPGGSAVRVQPTFIGTTNFRSDVLVVNLSGFGPGKTFSAQVDVDSDAPPVDTVENFNTVFFNNGSMPNAVARVYAGA